LPSLKISIFERTAQNHTEIGFIRDKLALGLAVAGDEVNVTSLDYEECDVAVILWSPREGAAERARAARKIRHLHSRNLLIFETPVLRGLAQWYFRAGFDHVHRAGRFFTRDMPADRARAMELVAKPWKHGEGLVFIAGQMAGDYSLDGVDVLEWAADVAGWIDRKWSRKVVLRPHPLDMSVTAKWFALASAVGADLSQRPLSEDLAAASAWVTFTSGSAVDAVMAGVPTICLSPNNFAWEVSGHSLNDLEKPWRGDRSQWIANLAYRQWTADEIGAGDCWRHLRDCVER
jgi:hypothetical protein